MLNMCGCIPEGWARIWFAEMLSAVLQLHGDDVAQYLSLPTEEEFKEYIDVCRNSSVEHLSQFAAHHDFLGQHLENTSVEYMPGG